MDEASPETINPASRHGTSADAPSVSANSVEGMTNHERRNSQEMKMRHAGVDVHSKSQGVSATTLMAGAQEQADDGKDPTFIDPTPETPRASSPSKDLGGMSEAEDEIGPNAEIRHIMEQFDTGQEEERQGKLNSSTSEDIGHGRSVAFPPRQSSLETGNEQSPAQTRVESCLSEDCSEQEGAGSGSSNQTVTLPLRLSSLPQPASPRGSQSNLALSKSSSLSLPKELPPTPDPEPDLPFDFHRFLEQLRHRTADPVAKYLRSFLLEFGKKQWVAQEQERFIHDFLAFIANKMAQCEVWRGVSDAEFDNAREGMEKLVMNRLYSQTFSPAIPPPAPIRGPKGKRKNIEGLLGMGRRGQHQEDVERDDILSQKVRIYSWVQEHHLDIKPVGSRNKRLLTLAQQELLKIKNYRAPRDKVICILNSCKVIFGLLRNSKTSDTSADAFVPLLILVVLHANPEHLVSNVQYIIRFRCQEKLGGEAGYYLSSLMGAIQFIENLDRTSLTVSDKEFEQEVEHAVSAIAERNQNPIVSPVRMAHQPGQVHVPEKSKLSQPEVVQQHSATVEPQRSFLREKLQIGSNRDYTEDDTAVDGLLRTIKRPLSSLGKIFTEDENTNNTRTPPMAAPSLSPRRLSPALFQPPRNDDERSDPTSQVPRLQSDSADWALKAEDAAARQTIAEAAEAHRIQQAEHQNVVETLAGMFPNLDRDVIDDVVRGKQGRAYESDHTAPRPASFIGDIPSARVRSASFSEALLRSLWRSCYDYESQLHQGQKELYLNLQLETGSSMATAGLWRSRILRHHRWSAAEAWS